VESGIVTVGDKLMVMPLGEVCTVKGIRLHHQQVDYAIAGDNADIGLIAIEPSHINMGAILCDPEFPVSVTSRLKAHIVTFSLPKPIIKGQQLEFYYQSLSEPAIITKLISILDKVTGQIKTNNPRFLTDQTTALVEIQLNRPLCIEKIYRFQTIWSFHITRNRQNRGRRNCNGIMKFPRKSKI